MCSPATTVRPGRKSSTLRNSYGIGFAPLSGVGIIFLCLGGGLGRTKKDAVALIAACRELRGIRGAEGGGAIFGEATGAFVAENGEKIYSVFATGTGAGDVKASLALTAACRAGRRSELLIL